MSTLQIAEKRIGTKHSPKVKPIPLSLFSEAAWAVFAFALFIVLGPFAVVAVIPALIHLIPAGSEPEPSMVKAG